MARGCAVLGAGGGGDPDLTLGMALCAVDEFGAVPVVGLDDLADDALVMPCGFVGSPSIAAERLFSGDEGRMLADVVAELHGAEVAALMPYAVGGANGLLPVTWAARTGLPIVDADGMGRAFPGLHQQAMHLAGVPAGPVVLTDGRGNTMILHAAHDRAAEHLARRAAASLGGVCAAALFCMDAATARHAAIAGSLSRALHCGRLPTPATELVAGRVSDLERRVDDGFGAGAATVQGVGRDGRRRVRLELQNEVLLAVEDGELLAAVPDIISLLDPDTGAAIQTERLERGQRVTVVTIEADPVWHSAAGLALGGPRAFGLDVDDVPLAAEPLDARV